MAFSLYFVGFIVFIAGVASLATALGVSETLVTAGALLLIALGLLAGILRHRAQANRAAV
jgi:uncharacterized membrane protein HdeD (DUF308 family)